MNDAPVATVAILTFNGEQYLQEVLESVFAQRMDRPFEVLVIDSGSGDRTLEIVSRFAVRLHQIPNAEFQHGRTRNLAVEMASGRHVAFVTQDATPAHPDWLSAMLESFDLDDRVVAVYGPHLPRPDADPKTRKELSDFFGGMGPSDRPTIHSQGDITFFSDVNACISKEFWRKVPYRELAYAEDQAMGRDVLEAGYLKVFQPNAAVVHSHNFPPLVYFRRMFDEWKGLKDSLGLRYPHSIYKTVYEASLVVRDDLRYVRTLRMSRAEKLKWALRISAMDFGRQVAHYLAEHADRLPPGVVDRLSQERSVKRKLRSRSR